VINNIIIHTHYAAIRQCEEVRNNYIYDSLNYGIYSVTEATGNHIEQFYGSAIYPGISFSLINDNVIINSSTSVSIGIDILATGKNATIQGNSIKGCKYGISLYATTNATVTGNRCYGCTNGIDERDVTNWCLVVANNCKGCTDGIDVDAANSVNEHNLE
jgi:parallel beta-helix repeat protein